MEGFLEEMTLDLGCIVLSQCFLWRSLRQGQMSLDKEEEVVGKEEDVP